jgi:hypothetical protein
VAVGSAAGAAGAFSRLVRRQWPTLAAGPAVAFSLVAPLAVVAGTYPFLMGAALALAALVAVQSGRPGLALAAAVLTALAHPLALVFLVVVLASLAAASRGWWRVRRHRVLAAGILVIGAIQLALMRAFASDGAQYPFDSWDALAIAGFCAAGLLLTRGLPDQRPMRALFAGYAVLAAAAFAVSSPLGGNVVRLLLLMGTPLLLLPLAARGFRPRALTAVCLVAVLGWQALPAVAGWRTSSAARAADESFWYPVLAFLDRHRDPNYRVQVVATADNWEAYWLARRDLALARGWYRQDDWPENEPLYRKLSPDQYRAWMRRMAVRYVLLPDDPLDPMARHEADLLRAGAALPVVARLGGWTVYRLEDATPIASPARDVRVLRLTADSITLRVDRPGRYRLRMRYTPYWHVERGQACVAPRRPWGTHLWVRRAGVVRVRFDLRLSTVVSTVLGGGSTCSSLRGPSRAPATAAASG